MEKWRWKKVPQAGFKIEGLNIAGFDRGNLLLILIYRLSDF